MMKKKSKRPSPEKVKSKKHKIFNVQGSVDCTAYHEFNLDIVAETKEQAQAIAQTAVEQELGWNDYVAAEFNSVVVKATRKKIPSFRDIY